ncbi:MAG: glycosyltransferase family 2 protein [Candidatus Omnitrophica bacterium]|nr:glycosyltransferase family 2 protein [Candidatus Omnitrophota bacterium]
MKKDAVSVVVVNYNRQEHLMRCLESVFAQSHKDIDVVLIDNASSDGSLEKARSQFRNIKIIKNNKNEFLAKAYNQGIRCSCSEYILCMNNDVYLDRDYIKNAVAKFTIDQRIGSVSGKLINPATNRIDSAGQFLSLSLRAIERGYGKKSSNYAQEEYLWGVGGACMLLKRAMLEDIMIANEYFDESFLAYLEDLDLNWRASKKKWKSYFAPDAQAFHSRGTTGWQKKHSFGYLSLSTPLKLQFIKNRVAVLIKNASLIDCTVYSPAITAYNIYLLIFLISEDPFCILNLIADARWLKTAIRKRLLQKYGQNNNTTAKR